MKKGLFITKLFMLLGAFVLSMHINAQQLDQIGKKDGIKLTGGVGATGNTYYTDKEMAFSNPYSYVISGNLNLSLYGFSIPMYFSYSDSHLSHSGQPLNIIGLSPSYKSLTLHLGYRSMTFSPLTLAGHRFFGIGVEWSYKGFSVAAMGGRLLEAVPYDSTSFYAIPTYARWGEGIKLEYSKSGNSVKGIMFYAKDDVTSVDGFPAQLNITPQENLVYSLGVSRRVNDVITVRAEGAMSAWTRDITETNLEPNDDPKQNVFFIDNNSSTKYYEAFEAGIDFKFEKFSTGLSYKRIEPEYHTLGAYNISNDFENISISASTAFFEKKLSVSGSLGLQHDDLENKKMTSMRRVVGSTNISYRPIERLSLTTSYSGYNSYTEVKPVEEQYVQNTVYDQLDTMNFIQITQTFSGGANYTLLDNDVYTHSVNANSTYQTAGSEQGSTRFGNTMTSGSAGYSISWKELGLSLGANLNGSVSEYDQGESLFAGMGINASMPFFEKKVRVSLGSNMSNNYQQGDLKAVMYAVTNSYAYRFFKNHSLSLNLRYAGRQQLQESELGTYNKSMNEFMGSIGYRYTFNVKDFIKPKE